MQPGLMKHSCKWGFWQLRNFCKWLIIDCLLALQGCLLLSQLFVCPCQPLLCGGSFFFFFHPVLLAISLHYCNSLDFERNKQFLFGQRGWKSFWVVLGTWGGFSRPCRNTVCIPLCCLWADSEDVALGVSVISESALTWCLPRAGRLGMGWKSRGRGWACPTTGAASEEELGGARTSLPMWLGTTVWDFFHCLEMRVRTCILLISQQPTVDVILSPRGSRFLWTFPFSVQHVSKWGLWSQGCGCWSKCRHACMVSFSLSWKLILLWNVFRLLCRWEDMPFFPEGILTVIVKCSLQLRMREFLLDSSFSVALFLSRSHIARIFQWISEVLLSFWNVSESPEIPNTYSVKIRLEEE